MKAAKLHGVRDIQLHDLPEPEPGAGEVLIRVGAVGLCGSDLHWFTEGGVGSSKLDRAVIPGHEFGGTIVAGPETGTRVAIDPAIPCLDCPQCAEGNYNLCPRVKFAGHDVDGPLAELIAWPRSRCVPVPDVIDDDGIALLEPLGVALHALDRAHLKAADSVAVVGCGPIGLFLIQLARGAGAGTILAVDPLTHRREAALAMGADDAIGPDDVANHPLHALTRVVFEVCGEPEAVAEAVHLARPGSRVVLVGIPSVDETRFPASEARRKGLTLVLSRRMGEVYERCIELVERGVVRLDGMVTASFPLAQSADAFEAAARRDGLKVTIHPGRAAD